MAKIISKIDIKLVIPPNFKNLTGRNSLEIELKAGQITDVSDKIAEYYVKSRPHIFRYTDQEDFNLNINNSEDTKEGIAEFVPLTFFESNADRIEEAIQEITDRKQLFAICKFMGLTDYTKQTNDRIKERIISDIKIQKEKQEKYG